MDTDLTMAMLVLMKVGEIQRTQHIVPPGLTTGPAKQVAQLADADTSLMALSAVEDPDSRFLLANFWLVHHPKTVVSASKRWELPRAVSELPDLVERVTRLPSN